MNRFWGFALFFGGCLLIVVSLYPTSNSALYPYAFWLAICAVVFFFAQMIYSMFSHQIKEWWRRNVWDDFPNNAGTL